MAKLVAILTNAPETDHAGVRPFLSSIVFWTRILNYSNCSLICSCRLNYSSGYINHEVFQYFLCTESSWLFLAHLVFLGGSICLNTAGSYLCNSVTCPHGYVKETSQSNRCKLLPCREPLQDCFMKPVTISYQFITFVSMLPIPRSGYLDLFTLRSTYKMLCSGTILYIIS